MSHDQNGAPAPSADADFAAAMKELARGEQTAAALEGHLDSLEKKIEELLAQAENAEKDMQTGAEKISSQGQPKSS
ncbi:uncharacterized protein M421DRAFT_4264 [Didymella exigua CBS 183.55]|uniref:Uncharacterized protein n=1 Tax=Didymella exigua CBS 183.55 TaxID=1150837 RepID=A0A6A5RN28_9PLEO|nr:uncharacterized protein M421DRAFT_4264 [Didymella exigua CBS 183.55]KAF1929835.1 hypothetical protein M421DRAFT_4264 [Didymella exigua CBS 183.55]